VVQLSYDELVEQERIREFGKGPSEAGDGPATKKAKKETSAGGFFKLEDKNNPHAYVCGLPTENFEVEQFKAFMSKCGIIQENGEGDSKIKLCVVPSSSPSPPNPRL
jgi:hypothetical protein